jgi:hypothetical protein
MTTEALLDGRETRTAFVHHDLPFTQLAIRAFLFRLLTRGLDLHDPISVFFVLRHAARAQAQALPVDEVEGAEG